MSTPAAVHPLDVTVTPFSSYPTSAEARAEVVRDYVLQAVRKARESRAWTQGKKFSYGKEKGGDVQSFWHASENTGKEGKMGWHGRVSVHPDIAYDSFRAGLLLHHAENEGKYIHELKSVERIAGFQGEHASVWLNGYKLPIVTKDRDFLELIITVDLPAHAEPFSAAHEEAIKQHFSSSDEDEPKLRPQAPQAEQGLCRSFLVIQVPVTHEQAPERTADYVRGRYASFEALSEQPHTAAAAEGQEAGAAPVEWRMAVQSDPAGSIPTFLTEKSMAGKIAVDVPSYVKWVRENNI